MSIFKAKAKTTFGPRVAVKHVPETGEVVTVYRQTRDLKLGDQVTVSPPGYDRPGIVIGTSANNPRYQNAKLCGGKETNMGEGYYQIKVMEVPNENTHTIY